MSPLELEALQTILGSMVGVGGVLTALVITTRYKLRRREIEVRSGGHEELGRAMETLRNEVQEAREEIAELSERVDFTERLLTKLSDRPGLPGS